MVRIYGDCLSGNCYKLKLVAELLGTPHRWKFVTWTDGGTRTEAFKSKINPAGKVPVLETSKGEEEEDGSLKGWDPSDVRGMRSYATPHANS